MANDVYLYDRTMLLDRILTILGFFFKFHAPQRCAKTLFLGLCVALSLSKWWLKAFAQRCGGTEV